MKPLIHRGAIFIHFQCLGTYIKYVGGREAAESFCRAHEIFQPYIDGSQNAFLCSFLILTFSKFIRKVKWV